MIEIMGGGLVRKQEGQAGARKESSFPAMAIGRAAAETKWSGFAVTETPSPEKGF